MYFTQRNNILHKNSPCKIAPDSERTKAEARKTANNIGYFRLLVDLSKPPNKPAVFALTQIPLQPQQCKNRWWRCKWSGWPSDRRDRQRRQREKLSAISVCFLLPTKARKKKNPTPAWKCQSNDKVVHTRQSRFASNDEVQYRVQLQSVARDYDSVKGRGFAAEIPNLFPFRVAFAPRKNFVVRCGATAGSWSDMEKNWTGRCQSLFYLIEKKTGKSPLWRGSLKHEIGAMARNIQSINQSINRSIDFSVNDSNT